LRNTLAAADGPEELRRQRSRALAAVAARDLCGHALDPLTEAWSAAADGALRSALRQAARDRGKVGLDEELLVLALGKHGSQELNWCSDVDLVAMRPSQVSAEDAEEVLREAFRLLEEPTALGLVLRIDLNLRPEGRTGPLCPVSGAALDHLRLYGRTWERAAWLRARPVAGDLDAGRAFLEELQPWIFRGHLDYLTLGALREMKDRIDAAQRPRRGWDIKQGRGGIREVEFLVQARQLVEGGRDPSLRSPHTRRALHALAAAGHLDGDDLEQLDAAYDFLRRLEHLVQIEEQRQTQLLADSEAARQRAARFLGFADPKGFSAALEQHRGAVGRRFEEFLEPPSQRARPSPRVLLLLGPFPDPGDSRRVADEAGFSEIDDALRRLALLREGPRARRLSEQGRRHFMRAAPVLLDAVLEGPEPDRALARVEALVTRLGARATLFALLAENPATSRLLVRLLVEAQAVSDTLLAHPGLLDELVGAAAPRETPDLESHRRDLAELCPTDPARAEAALAALRRYRHGQGLRIAVDEISGSLEAMAARRRLAVLARAVLERAFTSALAWENARAAERGQPPLPADAFAIVALGGLGAGHVSHSSDLDLMFVYDEAPDIDPGRWTRLAQRLITVLETGSREGIAYRLDLRLRPSGHQGPVVVSRRGWGSFLNERAALWERLALARARCLLPTKGAMQTELDRLARERGLRGADPAALHAEARRLRARQRRELASEGPDHYDLKYGHGGLAEANFLAALCARTCPLRAFQQVSIPHDVAWLRAAGADERQVVAVQDLIAMEHRLRLREGGEHHVLSWDGPAAAALARAFGETDRAALRSRVDGARNRINDAFETWTAP
jgi:glutamate-ammonia-ligase adenylyltransferase